MLLHCQCGSCNYRIAMKDFPAVKDKKGKVIKPPTKDVKVLVCRECGAETKVFILLHPDSKLEWTYHPPMLYGCEGPG